jgi:hypothetical protein
MESMEIPKIVRRILCNSKPIGIYHLTAGMMLRFLKQMEIAQARRPSLEKLFKLAGIPCQGNPSLS